ncbi:MAG: hypothetical protein AB7V55_07650 [Oscillospiraceae bacterium]
MEESGGQVTGDKLDVLPLDFDTYKLETYDVGSIANITCDAYPNGFSIVILPFDSAIHQEYAKNAAGYEDIFMKNILGWVAGLNLERTDQTPIAVNGQTGEVFPDKAVALHIGLPEDKTVALNIINIFSPDEDGPLLQFPDEGFSVRTALVDGKEVVFADYIAQNNIDTQLPIIGDYSGAGINVSIKEIEGDVVKLYAPVFTDIEYRMAKRIDNYAQAFHARIEEIKDANAVFACNCILNFLYGELEGKDLGAFYGPITFGEVAFQLVNQTLVYVQVM